VGCEEQTGEKSMVSPNMETGRPLAQLGSEAAAQIYMSRIGRF